MVLAVAFRGVADHLAAEAGVEVHVDVGHLGATRVQEPLEEQVVADRVDVDDAQAVGDARPGRAPAPGPDADPALAGVAHEVPYDEEVGGEPHRLDDAELVVEPFRHRRGDRVSVAGGGAGVGQLPQVGVLVVPGRGRERGEHRVAEFDLDVGSLGDEERVVARVLVVGEHGAHLRRGLQVELLAFELEAFGVVAGRPGLHAEERVVGFGVGPVGVVAVVGREQRGVQVVGEGEQAGVHPLLVGDAVVLELDEELVAAEHVLEPGGEGAGRGRVVGEEPLAHRAAEAAAGGDDPFAVLFEELEVDTRLVEEPVEVRVRRELDEVAVAGVVLGEEGEVEDLVLVRVGVDRSGWWRRSTPPSR